MNAIPVACDCGSYEGCSREYHAARHEGAWGDCGSVVCRTDRAAIALYRKRTRQRTVDGARQPLSPEMEAWVRGDPDNPRYLSGRYDFVALLVEGDDAP